MALVLREDRGRTGVIAVFRPSDPGDVHAMFRAIDAQLLELRADPACDAIVLRLTDGGAVGAALPRAPWHVHLHAAETLERIARTPKLVVAAIEGRCVGPALDVALAADVRIARPGATFGRAWVDAVGAPTGMARLAERIGDARALEWVFDGPASAVEARAAGLVHRVIPDEAWTDHLHAAVAALLDAGVAPGPSGWKRLPRAPDPAPEVEPARVVRLATPPRVAPTPEPRRSSMDLSVPPAFADPSSDSPAPSPARPRSAAERGAREFEGFEDFDHASADDDASDGAFADPGRPLEGRARADLLRTRIADATLNLLTRDLVERHRCIPVAVREAEITVAMVDPGDTAAVAEIADHTGRRVVPFGAHPAVIAELTTRHYRA